MAEYIEREDLLELYRMDDPVLNENGHVPLPVIRQNIMDIPAADVAPVRHGRWIGCNGEIVDWDENNPGCPRYSCFCSICKSWLTASDEFPVTAYFCPNCGAKMDGGAE